MKTIGLARLGKDAEVRRTPSGDAVCNLSLAVNYGQKDNEGNRPTQWIDASLWGKAAEALAPFLLRGTVHCFTLSDVHIEYYDKNDNTTGVKLVGRVDNVELGPKQATSEGSSTAPRGNISRPGAPAPRPEGQSPAPAPRAASGFDDMDDDIPF